MSRTKIDDRTLPVYTREAEVFNTVSHIFGSVFGMAALLLCISYAIIYRNVWGLYAGTFYGLMTIFLYTMSSVYHGLPEGRLKKIMQVIDHCSIYALIVGTYAPVLCTGLREYNPTLTAFIAALVTVTTAVGVTFTAIDFRKYAVISYAGYFVIGWSMIFSIREVYHAFCGEFVFWLVFGGIIYTLGMIFFGLCARYPEKHRFGHSVFHLFILGGTILQFIGIFKFCICR